MNEQGKHEYRSDVELGEKYRDPQTGIEGTATAVTFYQYACERVTLEWANDGEIQESSFDAPRLESVETGERVGATRTGGPGDPVPRQGAAVRRPVGSRGL